MTEEQLAEVRMAEGVPDLLSIDNLRNKTPRTLLFGYNSDRMTIHVYLCGERNRIVALGYGGYEEMGLHERRIRSNEDYVPTKRLYAECCDYEFCMLLKRRGVHLTFTQWQEREENTFYGKRI